MTTTQNTYAKYCPNVWVAKCPERHEKGEVIPVTTQYGKDNDSIVFNLVFEKDGFYYYSIVRADGYNMQERAKAKAERYSNWAASAEKKSDAAYKVSHSITENIPMGQPILIGHHSEGRHRRDLEKSWNAMGKSVELSNKAEAHESKSEYWAKRANDINLSMPESIEFYEFELEKAKAKHEGLKNGTIARSHSFSLTYAKKEVNEFRDKLNTAKKLWATE
jgi:hypothetical protein